MLHVLRVAVAPQEHGSQNPKPEIKKKIIHEGSRRDTNKCEEVAGWGLLVSGEVPRFPATSNPQPATKSQQPFSLLLRAPS
jgi:hypothetical protein